MDKRIIIVRIRGSIDVNYKVKDTLKMLRLFKKNSCSIFNNSESVIGMLKIIKDYTTWGELDKDTFKLLLEKRGKLVGNKQLNEDYLKEKLNYGFDAFAEDFINFKKELKDVPGLKQFFRLMPPIKGYERAGIKKPFSMGGALGYRKEKINDLVKRMV